MRRDVDGRPTWIRWRRSSTVRCGRSSSTCSSPVPRDRVPRRRVYAVGMLGAAATAPTGSASSCRSRSPRWPRSSSRHRPRRGNAPRHRPAVEAGGDGARVEAETNSPAHRRRRADRRRGARSDPDPDVGSILSRSSADRPCPGSNEFPVEDRPPANVVHLSFQTMVGSGIAMIGIALWFWWEAAAVGRPDAFESRWLMRAAVRGGRAERRRARGRMDHHRGRTPAVDRLRRHARRGCRHRELRDLDQPHRDRGRSYTAMGVAAVDGAAVDGSALARRPMRSISRPRTVRRRPHGARDRRRVRAHRCRRESQRCRRGADVRRRRRLRAVRRGRLRQRRVGPPRRW